MKRVVMSSLTDKFLNHTDLKKKFYGSIHESFAEKNSEMPQM